MPALFVVQEKNELAMITKVSKKMLVKSFEKTTYRFTEAPEARFKQNYGIYVHVPFCETKCTFCPFYKEIYSPELKEAYLQALLHEINTANITGEPFWVYFGGGTPNLLTVEDLKAVGKALRDKVQPDSMGIELLTRLLTREYLGGLKETGFTKVSLGIETMQPSVLQETKRVSVEPGKIIDHIAYARELGLWVNADMMVGLPGQDTAGFLEDIRLLAQAGPSQVTIYPYMVIRNVKAKAGMADQAQFELIEKAWKILEEAGYERKGIWIFARGSDIYDSSRDELVTDYAGFGPAAFSTHGNWKVVNPDLHIYLKNHRDRQHMAFVAPKSKATDDWRLFARMIYDLHCKSSKQNPSYINLYIGILKAAGFSFHGSLSKKGIMFAHHITKAVVESLPFPLQNEHIVENFEEYRAAHISSNLSHT